MAREAVKAGRSNTLPGRADLVRLERREGPALDRVGRGELLVRRRPHAGLRRRHNHAS